MKALSNQRLVFPLFIVSFLVASEICVADLDLSANISTNCEDTGGSSWCSIRCQIIVRMYWTAPEEDIFSYILYADGSRIQVATSSQTSASGVAWSGFWQADPLDYPDYSSCMSALYSQWDAFLQEYFSEPHTFEIEAIPRNHQKPSITDVFYYEPPQLIALEPDPPDGSTTVPWINSLTWSPGEFADKHDVYLGDNFGDVRDADITDTTGIYKVRQNSVIYTLPESLELGRTYYWRIDEVEADGTTKYKGDIWSFLIPPRTAYNPTPADGAKFIYLNVELNWTGGFGAKLHTVYFGDNFVDVNNATGGLPQEDTIYTPDTLKLEKTYYWRVDEFNNVNTYKGEVWSFTTKGIGGGVRGDYFNGTDLSNHVLSRIDPRINFNWGSGAPVEVFDEDNFSVRWTGEVEVVFAETYIFYANTDDGVRLWMNDQLIIDRWMDRLSAGEEKGTIDLIGGQRYPIVMEYFESGGSAVAKLLWSSPRTPKQLIPQAALSPPIRARDPKPPNGATNVTQTPILSWKPGEYAASHLVYLGTDQADVRNANTGSPEYKGIRDLGYESFDPGKLEWDITYYWRVDEVNRLNPDSPWVGDVWSFTTGAGSLPEALDTPLGFATGGSAKWFLQHKTFYYDGDAAQSGGIPSNQESWMQATVSEKGTVSFYWKVSSERYCDFLEFYIDGSLQDQISGSVDWQQMMYTLPSGSHTLEWRYVKDYAMNSGSDCAWVDLVEWVTN